MEANTIVTDVCIIGAGPAGLTASMVLSKQQIHHYLVDAETFPRHKPCGDILTSGVVRALNDLDPNLVQELRDKKIFNPISKTLIYPPNGNEICIDFLPFDRIEGEPSVYSISRFTLDEILINKARETNYATIKEGCYINAVTKHKDYVELSSKDGSKIQAKMVIVATGSNNSVLRLLNMEFPKKHCSVGMRVYFEGIDTEDTDTELFLDSEIMPGGLFITPFSNNKFNVNMIFFLENVIKDKMNLRETFEGIIERNPVLKHKFRNAKRTSSFQGYKLHMGIKQRHISDDRILITGDSAGLIDIISGNGIPQAMTSGKFAALQSVKALQENNFSKEFLKVYDVELHKKINKTLVLGKICYPFLKHKFISKISLRVLSFISTRSKTNEVLRNLLYDNNVKAKLFDPRFYFRLMFK